MVGNANGTERRPRAVSELDGAALVAGMHASAVGPGGAEGEPERIVERAVINAGINVGTTRLPAGKNAIEPVGEDVPAIDAEHDDRRKAIASDESLRVELDDTRLERRTHLRTRIENQSIESQGFMRARRGKRLGRKVRRDLG